MTDREKVMLAVPHCLRSNDCSICEACPYNESNDYGCRARLRDDIVRLLKAQEPRLVTESDFDGADEYGYIPVWTEEKDGDMYWECIPKVAITDPDGIEVLRYWTSRPDQATREATPWN